MSALAVIDPTSQAITIKSTFNFYGKYAEPVLAERIVAEINAMWNAPKAKIKVEKHDYIIVFETNFVCLSNEAVVNLVLRNQDFTQNFIRIEDKNVAERSLMGFGLGENSGHWLITDQLGESTTAAHEYGHALGLPHPEEIDFRNSGMPPIMAPRGTLVDSEYQWNPLAEIGAFGGTMRPIWRRVRAYEVMEIFKNKDLKESNEIPIGVLTNYLFDEIGRVSSIIA